MANEYNIISDEALDALCGAIKGIANAGEILDDTGVAMDKTYSSFKIQEELDKKIEKDEVIKKTDILTANSTTPTNEQVYSASIMNDILNGKIDKPVTLSTTDEINSFDRNFQIFMIASSVTEAVGLPISPKSSWLAIHLTHTAGYKFPSQIAFEYAGLKRIMYRVSVNGVWGSWMKICTTTVTDVPFTELTVNNWATGSVTYTVENGTCYIWISGLASSTMDTNSQTIVSNLPKPKRDGLWYNITSSDCTKGGLLLAVTRDGKLQNYTGLNNTTYFGTFSYPVAE